MQANHLYRFMRDRAFLLVLIVAAFLVVSLAPPADAMPGTFILGMAGGAVKKGNRYNPSLDNDHDGDNDTAAEVANFQARAALLASAPRMRKNLGTFQATIAAGAPTAAPTRIKLLNVGIGTRLVLLIETSTTIGTATATVSARGPYNLISRVRLVDFDGTERVNCSGFQLFVWNSVRERMPYGINNAGLSARTTLPNTPTAVATAAGQFLLEIPLAYDPEKDLRGAVMAQTSVGEWYLIIDWNTSPYTNGAIDSLYSGAATTTVSMVTVQATVFQEYLLPQALADGTVPLPKLDLQTVYEFAGNLTMTDNLAANTERLINLPNVRQVIGSYVNYINNNAMADADLSKIALIANGNNRLKEFTKFDKVHEQRLDLEGDMPAGTWWDLSRNDPIETSLYGMIQLGFTPANFTANASTRLEVGFESFYRKGSALPGMSQSAG